MRNTLFVYDPGTHHYYLGSLDTTIRLKYTLTSHPILTTPASLSTLLSPFGATDTPSIVIALKPPKKAPNKPPKFATALVPFRRIGDAFAAVCASGRPERGLGDIDVGWAEGKEPQILGWLRQMGKLGAAAPTVPGTSEGVMDSGERKAPLPQAQTRGDTSTFSSFPESFVSQLLLIHNVPY